MHKLPISKYKNAAPKLVKKDQSINSISTNRLLNTSGNLINCSLNYVAFAYDTQSTGGSICCVTHQDFSKKQTFNASQFGTTHAQSGQLSDIQFSPFINNILATSGYDQQICLWSLSDDNGKVSIDSTRKINLLNETRCDLMQWNPNVENILLSSSLSNLYLWDVEYNLTVNTIQSHSDAVQSVSWKRDGSLLVSSSKDKSMQLIDPRNNDGHNKIENAKTNTKDSKCVWIGNSDFILSSVYTGSQQRELYLWDVRNTSDVIYEMSVDMGNSVLNPYFDHDTGMLFLVGRAENTIKYCEVNPEVPNIVFNSLQPLDDQIKSVAVLPKFGLDLMKGEINRLLLLTRTCAYPLPYIIPRRSYHEFHVDLFPETFINQPNISKDDYLNGKNGSLSKIKLNPDTQKQYNSSLAGIVKIPEVKVLDSSSDPLANGSKSNGHTTTTNTTANASANSVDKKIEPSIIYEQVHEASKHEEPDPVSNALFSNIKDRIQEANKIAGQQQQQQQQSAITTPATTPSTPATPATPALQPTSFNMIREKKAQNTLETPDAQNRAPRKSIYYQSKFKYINGKIAHKNEQITNIRNLSTMWPGECNGFQINPKRAAFLLSGGGAQIGVVELNKPGRLTDVTIYSIINKSKVSDFAWDPFNDERLAVACDEGVIKIWQLPAEGLICSLEDPHIQLTGHLERLYCIKYHPFVRNLLASASYDRTIRLWNVDSGVAVKILTGHTDVVFSMSWSPCGSKLATICKDGFIRVYEPAQYETPVIQEKAGPPQGGKAARIEWVLNGEALCISGFGKLNSRQLYLYGSEDMNLMGVEEISQSPSLLIPFYDPDINVLFLYAKGEEVVHMYEIQYSEPYFQVLSPYKPEGGIHFALAFLPKQYCDIKQVEIAKAYRLTKDNRIERISFFVPRVKLTLFQDDIFPDTIDRRSPYLEASEWFASNPINFNYINLQPADMQKLSEVLALEQEQNLQAKRESKKANENSAAARGMLDPNQLGDSETLIINRMLQRATLYKEDTSEEEEDNEDWQ